MTTHGENHPDAVDGSRYRRAFAVADALNVHGADCVCPGCAARLPRLLPELARALAVAERDPVD